MKGWCKFGRAPNWSASYYVTDWLNYTSKIAPNVFGAKEFPLWERDFKLVFLRDLVGLFFNADKNHWNVDADRKFYSLLL